jgi:hypothetical protein
VANQLHSAIGFAVQGGNMKCSAPGFFASLEPPLCSEERVTFSSFRELAEPAYPRLGGLAVVDVRSCVEHAYHPDRVALGSSFEKLRGYT